MVVLEALLISSPSRWTRRHQQEMLTGQIRYAPGAVATPSSRQAEVHFLVCALGLSCIQQTVVSRAVLREMVTVAWVPVLTALSFLLSKTSEEGLIQHLLVAMQNFTNITGLLGLTTARDRFLDQLCRFALPSELRDGVYARTCALIASQELLRSISQCPWSDP